MAKDPDGDQQLTVFDSANFDRCFSDNAQAPWLTIGIECGSPFPPLAVVSTENNPADLHEGINTYDYLGKKGDVSEQRTSLYYSAIGAPPSFPADPVNAHGLYDGKSPSDPTALATDRFIPPDCSP